MNFCVFLRHCIPKFEWPKKCCAIFLNIFLERLCYSPFSKLSSFHEKEYSCSCGCIKVVDALNFRSLRKITTYTQIIILKVLGQKSIFRLNTGNMYKKMFINRFEYYIWHCNCFRKLNGIPSLLSKSIAKIILILFPDKVVLFSHFCVCCHF